MDALGGSAALVNFLFMVLFVEFLGFKSYFLKNLANVLAMEASILYNFFLCRLWTWGDAPRKKGKDLLAQMGFFHLAALSGIAIRIVLFALLEKWGLFYLVNVANVAFGIGAAASINYVLYDKIVFKREGAYEGKIIL